MHSFLSANISGAIISPEQTPFVRVLTLGTHYSAESTKTMQCHKQGHNILIPLKMELAHPCHLKYDDLPRDQLLYVP